MDELDNAQKKFYIMNVAGSESDIEFPSYEKELEKHMTKHSIDMQLKDKELNNVGSIYFTAYSMENEKVKSVDDLIENFKNQELIVNGLVIWDNTASITTKIHIGLSESSSYISLATINSYEDNPQKDRIHLSEVVTYIDDNI